MLEFILLFSIIAFIIWSTRVLKNVPYIYEGYNESRKWIVENSWYIVLLILVILLSYGFTLTNYSIGIDDEYFNHYFRGEGLLAQGRISAYLIKLIFDPYFFLPFWTDFLAIIGMGIGLLIWALYFFMISKKKMNFRYTIIFILIAISSPIIATKFIFMGSTLNIGIRWILVGLALITFFHPLLESKRNISVNIITIILVTLSVIFGEESAPLFLCGTFMGMFLIVYGDADKLSFKKATYCTIRCIVMLFIAIILEGIISEIILRVNNIEKSLYVSNFIFWNKDTLTLSGVMNLIKTFIENMKDGYNQYIYIKLYILTSITTLLISILLSVKNKRYMYILLNLGISITCISLIIFTGNVYLPARTMMIYTIYIGFMCMFIYSYVRENFTKVKPFLVAIVTLIILVQSRDMNIMFFNDHTRYEMDKKLAYEISTKIEEESGVTSNQTVVFIGVPDQYPAIKKYDVNGWSMFWWDRNINPNQNTRIVSFFEMLGYTYNLPSEDQIIKANENSRNMPKWPQKGSVKQVDDYVIVKLGDSHVEESSLSIEEFMIKHSSNDNEIMANIDRLNITEDTIDISGWGILKNIDSSDNKIKLALVKENKQYIIKANSSIRLDVTEYFNKEANYDNSGFNFNCNLNMIESGDYDIGIIIKRGNISEYYSTGKILNH